MKSENPANLLARFACFAPVLCWLGLCGFASLVLVVCFVWVVGCVVGGFLSLRMIATKRKGKLSGLVLSFVGCELVISLCSY